MIKDEVMDARFVEAFNWKAQQIHGVAREKGFWDSPRNVTEMLMLVVTEIAEAVEALRHGNPPDDKVPQFTGLDAELADAVIRLMDLAPGIGVKLAEAIVAKVAFNRTRPYKHGKQF